jgi:hypothetical protein
MPLSDQDNLTIVCPICKHTVTKTVHAFRESGDPTCDNCKASLDGAITVAFVRQGLTPPPRSKRV